MDLSRTNCGRARGLVSLWSTNGAPAMDIGQSVSENDVNNGHNYELFTDIVRYAINCP